MDGGHIATCRGWKLYVTKSGRRLPTHSAILHRLQALQDTRCSYTPRILQCARLGTLSTTRNKCTTIDAPTIHNGDASHTTTTVFALEETEGGGMGPHVVGDSPIPSTETTQSALGPYRMGDSPACGTTDLRRHHDTTSH